MKMKEKKAGERTRSGLELNGKPLNFHSIMKEVQLFGSSDMTWKERKELQDKKVVSLGGKAPKNQRLPLSVARPMMKNSKKREERMLQQELLIRQCGEEDLIKKTKKHEEKHKREDSVLKSSEGRFRNGVLDVKHLLKAAPKPRDDDRGPPMIGRGGKKTKGGRKKGGKKKGGGRKRH